MHLPKQFKQDDWENISQLIGRYPLACLTTLSDTGLVAEHIPLVLAKNLAGQWCLQGHIARANPLAKRLNTPLPTLVVFQGESAYVSPNYYPTKAVNPKVVPTWNYQAVHVNGLMTAIDDGTWKLDLLQRLTKAHEQTQAKPWQINDAPSTFIEGLNKAIVGIEISIDNLQAKYKLSQNQSVENQQGVANGLASHQPVMAELIQQHANAQMTKGKNASWWPKANY